MKPVRLSIEQWKRIREELQTEYPRTVFMLRNKMRQVLGFTVREHSEWVGKPDGGYSDYSIHLDFYSEHKRTMFLMKFSEVISEAR